LEGRPIVEPHWDLWWDIREGLKACILYMRLETRWGLVVAVAHEDRHYFVGVADEPLRHAGEVVGDGPGINEVTVCVTEV
jgi:hypothetical protein